MPAGTVYEAESGWREDGGKIRVSGGGHANVSGQDNLWGWNQLGHTLFWDVRVDAAGRYEIWFVGATSTGLLAELTVDNGAGVALWFRETGGWGRKVASEWQAFRVRDAGGRPAVFDLSAAAHTLALTNWSGMGLNLDRIVLAPAP